MRLVRFVLLSALFNSTLAPTSSLWMSSPLLFTWCMAIASMPVFHLRFVYAKRTEMPSVSAPMHILQLCVWERFPELRPAMASVSESVDDGGTPRASRWHNVYKALDLGFAHAVLMASKEYEWRPYGSSYWCAAMASTMAMQLELGHCCPLQGNAIGTVAFCT